MTSLFALSPPQRLSRPTASSDNYSLVLCVLSAVVLALSGCATLPKTLTPEQCQASNWEGIGYADGSQGRSGAYFSRYVDQCGRVAGASPNRERWEQGRQQGLTRYCTPLNAYKRGREGYDWQPVCPLEGIDALEEAYAQGRYYYLRQRDLEYLYAPYPFGVREHYPYGYRPFGYRW